MATIEEVVEMWNETCSNQKNKASEITQGHSYGRTEKEAVIKLSDTHPFKPWPERTCYVFSFNSDKNNNLAKIEISFQRRTKEHPNTQAFYEFLKENFSEKFTLNKGRINPNHLVLKRVFPLNSSAQNICNGMKELIESTQKRICEFLEDKNNEKLLTENQEKIFSEIMKKYKVKEDDKLYGKCEDIYNQTIKILKNLHIGSEEVDKFLEVSYYTQKNIARSLFTEPKDKRSEFRLYYTYGMNDPSEGKTLLSFLGIENEDLELPEPLPFIACFSLEINSLNQFRLYGNEDNKEANGVSIVFDFDFFSDDINKKDGKYPLYHCVYIDLDKKMIESISFSKKDEKENQKEIENRRKEVEDLFKKLKNKIQELLKIDNKDINEHELAKDLLINIRYLVKDYAFMEERECRIIDMRNKRNKKDKSIEIDGERLYIEIGEVKNYISEVYFAPLAEGMEVFEIETGKKCIRSRHPYKSKELRKMTPQPAGTP